MEENSEKSFLRSDQGAYFSKLAGGSSEAAQTSRRKKSPRSFKFIIIIYVAHTQSRYDVKEPRVYCLYQLSMSLKKYNSCDESHSADFQYVCLKEKKVFCLKCWFKTEHYRYCYSSRCGQYDKIAHLVLNRALQYKNSKLLEEMSESHKTYQALRVRFLQLNFQVTEILKEFVEQKMPLLFWGMANQLLRASYGSEPPQGYHKFDSYCTEMIKIIKSNDPTLKQDYLESAIGAYYDINHQLQGELNQSKASQFQREKHMQEQVNVVLEKTNNELRDLLKNIKKGFRTVMDSELDQTTKKINETVKYKGVTVQKITPENQCFRKKEEYPYLGLIALKHSQITNEETELHMGFNMTIKELEACPEQLLQIGKCLIKEKLYQMYESITTVKSVFPYKYVYPIATTLTSDQEFEQLIIDLERTAIDCQDRTNPFLSSLNLIVMGREVIVIRFQNHPKFYLTRKIYNYKPERKDYYDTLMEKLDLKTVPCRSQPDDNIPFTEELTETQLAYCNFRIAYESIFLFNGQDFIFQGGTVLANRGAEQFPALLQKWKKTAKIDMEFDEPFSEMLKYFV